MEPAGIVTGVTDVAVANEEHVDVPRFLFSDALLVNSSGGTRPVGGGSSPRETLGTPA